MLQREALLKIDEGKIKPQKGARETFGNGAINSCKQKAAETSSKRGRRETFSNPSGEYFKVTV